MVGFSIQRYRIATLSDNRADNPDRLTIAFKYAPLLDVQFNKGFNVSASVKRFGGESKAAGVHRINKTRAFGVLDVADIIGIRQPKNVLTAPEDIRETAAFFFCHRDHFDCFQRCAVGGLKPVNR